MRKIQTVRDLKGEVYKIIRQSIIDRTLPPGTQLKETELAEEMSVSRTPIREALNQLSKEGIVEIIPRKGAFVKQWTREEAVENLLIREVLEGLAARMATHRLTPADLDRLEGYLADYKEGGDSYMEIDRRFHSTIINACGLTRLIEMIRNLQFSIQMIGALMTSFNTPGRIKDSLAEHRRIIEALRGGDEDTVERVAREHLKQTRKFYVKYHELQERV